MAPKIRRTPLTPKATDEVDGLVIRLADLRQQGKVIAEQVTEVQEELVDAMNRAGTKSHVVVDGTKHHSVNVQTNTSRTINEAKLKRKVGPGVWRRITTLVLDRKKVDALVADGTIDPVDLADCVDESESKPFIRITTK